MIHVVTNLWSTKHANWILGHKIINITLQLLTWCLVFTGKCKWKWTRQWCQRGGNVRTCTLCLNYCPFFFFSLSLFFDEEMHSTIVNLETYKNSDVRMKVLPPTHTLQRRVNRSYVSINDLDSFRVNFQAMKKYNIDFYFTTVDGKRAYHFL